MPVVAAKTETWTYLDGNWHEGNVAVAGPLTHAFWLGSSVFDGARAFDGVTPDVDRHFARVNASATALGLAPTHTVDEMLGLLHEGLKRFSSREAIYIRPMYWADSGGYMGVPSDPETTRFLLCLYVAPMIPATGFSLGISPYRRPSLETMPTNAKAGCLYPNSGRAILEAKRRGYDNALMLDMLGNVAETGTSNLFLVKDGVVKTPVPNGSFLAGITRARTIDLLRREGVQVEEQRLTVEDFLDADEVFSSGNHSKIVPVIGIESRVLQPGPVARTTRELYMDWAHSA